MRPNVKSGIKLANNLSKIMKHTPGPNDKLMLAQAKAEYNLTAALIRLLPEPEVMSRGRGLRPYKIWRRSDIETMLTSPEAQPHIAVRDAKQAAAAKANLTKEERRVLAAINNISCPRVNPRELVNCADTPEDIKYLPHELLPIAGFEDYWEPSQPQPPLDEEEQKVALQLVLRHLARYDHDYFIRGVAKDSPDYFKSYRYAVLDTISAVYPDLKDVCERRKMGS